MKQSKKALSVALFCIAAVCLILAIILAVKYMWEDAQSENSLEPYRVTVSPQPHTTPSNNIPENTDVLPDDTTGTIGALPDDTATEPTTEPDAENTDSPLETEAPQPTATPVLTVPHPYTDSFLANKDMAGWLVVPDTNIDYPIMWTPRDENYYLYRDFNGSDDVNGSLILDTDSSLDPLTTNLIIHGHNMKSGAMFGNLTDYEDEDYFKEHKQITLYTEECQRNYEIIAVFRSQVYKKSDKVFKFYKFFQADTQEEFDDFYNNIKKLSLYDTGVTAEFGDHFITLSTCVYHVTNGRFVVVAKEVAPGDTYEPIER